MVDETEPQSLDAPITPPRRVVFFGDSRAAWWDVPVLPRLRCVAVGVPGGAAESLARQFRTIIQPLRPDTVVVQMGVNDLAGLTARSPDSAQRIAAAVDAIGVVVRQAHNLGASVILTTIFPRHADHTATLSCRRRLPR